MIKSWTLFTVWTNLLKNHILKISCFDPKWITWKVFFMKYLWCCYCFNVVDQRWNNVDPTLKMEQNSTSNFQHCSCRRWNNVETTLHNVETTLHNVGATLIQRCFNLASTLVKAIFNPIGLVMIVGCKIVEYMLNTSKVFILLNEKTFFYYILTA